MSQTTVLAFDEAKAEQFREKCERRILHTSQLMTVIIDFGNGPWEAADPMHSHPHEQITYLAEGEILFLAADAEPRKMQAGDMFAVPSRVPHSIQLLSKTARLIDSFNPIREDFLG